MPVQHHLMEASCLSQKLCSQEGVGKTLQNDVLIAPKIINKGKLFSVVELTPDNALQFKTGYLELLNQLTSAQDMDDHSFLDIVKAVSSTGAVFLIVDRSPTLEPNGVNNTQSSKLTPSEQLPESSMRVVGASKIFFEQKFARGGAKVGHIEDVVVDSEYRGYGLGKIVVDACTNYAHEVDGCYKVILDCTRENIPFYEKCGFKEKEVQMRIDIPSRM